MDRDNFLAAVEAELHPLGVPFTRADLVEFLTAAWPLVEDDPDAARWARGFLEARARG
jgi:hypothetical protein